MKKALAILMIFALVASVAFAEVSIGAWGRGLFVPVYSTGADGDTAATTNKASWGGNPRIGFTISGSSDNVGFQVDLKADSGKTLDIGDQSKIWVKPMDMLKISLGRVYVDNLRGNAAFGSWNWDRAYGDGSYGEDFTFTRVMTAPNSRAWDNAQGVVFEVTPMDALFFAVAFRDVNGEVEPNRGKIGYDEEGFEIISPEGRTTSALFSNMQAAIGYTIQDVGQIKAQIMRSEMTWKVPDFDMGDVYVNVDADKNDDTVELAFNLTMIENLFAEIGYRMTTESDLKQVNLYGNYKMDAFTFHVASRFELDKSYIDDGAVEEGTGIYVGGGVDYDLGNGIGVSGDIRFQNDVMVGGGDSVVAFFAGVTKGFSNGLIGAGVEVVSAGDTGYSVPVRFEYWF